MSAYVLGERREEARTPADALPAGFVLVVPGVPGLEIVDASRRGVGVRSRSMLRPGRSVALRHRPGAQGHERACRATVVRCEVFRLNRTGIVYEAGLRLAGIEDGRGGV